MMTKSIKHAMCGFLNVVIPALCLLCATHVVGVADDTSAQTATTIPIDDEYIIGAGDVLEIMVWGNAELSKTLPVRPDGKISLPLVGDIVVEGKKVRELTGHLQEMYVRYVTRPTITVAVQQVNSMKIYVIGRVNAPGVKLITDKTNVLQALAMASGLNPFAEGDAIKIFRTEEDGTTSIIDFDYDEVARGRNLQQNIFLKRRDVIVVP